MADLVESRHEIYVFVEDAADAFPGFHQVNDVGSFERGRQERFVLKPADGGLCAQCLNGGLPVGPAADDRNRVAFAD